MSEVRYFSRAGLRKIQGISCRSPGETRIYPSLLCADDESLPLVNRNAREEPQQNNASHQQFYTTYTNIKRKRSGHLFQGRYKAIIVDKDNYLLELSRYLHLNPVRAKHETKA